MNVHTVIIGIGALCAIWLISRRQFSKLLKKRIPNHDLPYKLGTDSSNFAAGCVLTQFQHGVERVIAYMSQKYVAQRKYHTTEKECLALILAGNI